MKKPKNLLTIVLSALVGAILAVLIMNWDTTKKAAKDAWEGKHELPSAQAE
jgi:hypothetical protein